MDLAAANGVADPAVAIARVASIVPKIAVATGEIGAKAAVPAAGVPSKALPRSSSKS